MTDFETFAEANAFVTEWNDFVVERDAPERAKWPLRKEDRKWK